jgi:DNA-binding transcriptional MerR regulator/methylmalonyl-CoA mutase cobalamin-binding subunit
MRYRMKTVSEMTGIPRPTLVAWERRHGIPEPERLANGYRLYSEADVQLLLRLRDALARGLSISEAIELERSGEGPTSPAPAPVDAAGGFAAVGDDLLDALLDFDRPRAERVIERILAVPYLTAITEVYFPLLREVGTRWEAGEATVAQEHFASAFVRDQLVAMRIRVGTHAATGPRVACATFPGEKHELALLGLAVHLSLKGCRVTYLGADVPTQELARFVQQTRPDCVCVSAIVATERRAVTAFCRELRRRAPGETRIVLGGAGLPDMDGRAPEGVEIVGDWRTLTLP